MSANPWLVENIQEFSFLNCPECAFKVKEEDKFQDHAVRNHSQSSALFGHNEASEFITVKSEPSSEICLEDFKHVSSSNVDEITGLKITIDDQENNPLGSISPKKEKPLKELIKIVTSTSNIDKRKGPSDESSNKAKIIPTEKFPKKDKTTSIFKCQIPPKKIPKPIIADEHHSHQEEIKASTSTIQKRKGSSDQSSNKAKRTKVQLKSSKDLKCNFCNFSTSERSDLVFHFSEHLSINSDGEIYSEPFKDELSSNVDDEITLHQEQKNSNKQDLDIGVKLNEVSENTLVDKVIANVRITPKILKIIPMEKFPQKDKTTSIFKCQIPPKKIPKPIIADKHHSNQEKMS